MTNITYNVEHTDTFAGEANYSWVVRKSFEAPADASTPLLVRRAKALIGETGSRTRTDDLGDTIQLDYPGRCVRTFITAEF